ncbi:MAG: amidohydrolase family protein [Oscillospiraceae bacterium]|nr:amidohydrolase family protein [Oscillospiraceae bacterium]
MVDTSVCIYNAFIKTMSEAGDIENGYVKIKNGKIAEVSQGKLDKISDGDINAKGHILCPGFIDIHTHMGLIGDGMGQEGDDVNEGSDPVMPHLRAIDGINFRDNCFADAVKAGVTTVVTGVGSLNPIGGDMLAIKTAGRTLDEAVICRAGIKFALGENPKSYYTDREEAPQTRLATAALIREALYKAQRYMEQKEAAEDVTDLPEYDIKCEALIPLLKGKLAAHIHCHRADDILTALRIRDEFNLRALLVHCTEGHLIADILAERQAVAVIGPIICDRGKPELANASLGNAAELMKAGVPIAICTDHPETPIQFLAMGAALCAKHGLPRDEAFKAITVNAARLGGFGDRTGSVETGKDADLILLDNDPFDIFTNVTMTMVGGKIVFKN